MADNPFHLQALFVAADIEPGLLRVTRVRAREEISRFTHYDVDLVCDGGAFDPTSLLRKPASVVIVRDDGELVRRFCGIVMRAAERVALGDDRQVLRVHIEEPLALLRHSSDRRIFQDTDVKLLIEQMCADAGIDPIEVRLSSPARKRPVCTQYGETMRAFLDRLLEEDGIFWFVEHGEDGAKVIFGDGPSAFTATDGEIPFRDGSGLQGGTSIRSLSPRAAARPAKVTLRDHDFAKPTLNLEVEKAGDAALAREHYEYPGRYFLPAEGAARAATLLAAHTAATSGANIEGRAPELTAGHSFQVVDTEGAIFDRKWVTISAEHEWEEATETKPQVLVTRARVIPDDMRFAPEAITARPRAHADLAMVTTPAGEEIHCDEHGRIKVQFHWDRYGKQDDKSSFWVRVGQMQTSGSVVIPRRNWELLVQFEDGDPDRPIALGRLYNPSAPPTDSLPGGKTNSALVSYSTPGGSGHNEFRMNDGGGGELVQMHAQKDLNLVVANNKEEKVTTKADVGVTVDHSCTIGANQTVKVGSNDQIQIGGSQTYKVSAARTKTVTGDEKLDVTGSRSVTIGASHTTLTPMSVDVSTKGNLTETVGGLNLEVAALGVALAVAGSTSITVGGAKIEAVAAGKNDMTIGARASTVGGAFINVTPKDVSFSTKASKVTTVGGAWMGNAGGDAELSSKSKIDILVGGAVAMNATAIIMKVGGSSVTIAGGSVYFQSSEVKLTASGPMAELAAMVSSK
jgi:type VI secretion system secreted protein VgrG